MTALGMVPDAMPSARTSERVQRSRELGETILVLLRLGTLLARSGAAAFRVREAMQRTAVALGVERSEFVVAVDSIAASVFDGAEFRTQVVRVPHIGVDMNVLCRIEMMTRGLVDNGTSPSQVDEALDALQAAPRVYPRWITIPSLGAACAAFCGAGHGSLIQMTVAFGGAAAGHAVRLALLTRHIPLVTIVVTCAFTSCLACELISLPLRLTGIMPQAITGTPGMETLASVLYLIPGVPLVTSLVDLLHGDMSCGISRAALATLIIGSIAVGMFTFFAVARVFPW